MMKRSPRNVRRITRRDLDALRLIAAPGVQKAMKLRDARKLASFGLVKLTVEHGRGVAPSPRPNFVDGEFDGRRPSTIGCTSMKTERERAKALIEAIDSVDAIPRSLTRQLRELVARWRPPRLEMVGVVNSGKIGHGTHAALERLCNAAENYIKALEDAKALLEVR